jgi:hypothetical protein
MQLDARLDFMPDLSSPRWLFLRHGTSREGSESTAVPPSSSATSPNLFECALNQAHAIVSWRRLQNLIKKVKKTQLFCSFL